VPVYTGLSSNQGSLCAGKTPPIYDRLSEGHYTVLTLEQLLHVNQLVNLITLLESTTAAHLSYDTTQLLNFETKQILKNLFNSLKKNQCVKIILTTQLEDETVKILKDIAKKHAVMDLLQKMNS
jgi:dihydrodipicolinate reductase